LNQLASLTAREGLLARAKASPPRKNTLVEADARIVEAARLEDAARPATAAPLPTMDTEVALQTALPVAPEAGLAHPK
jgi:hypothetical protein